MTLQASNRRCVFQQQEGGRVNVLHTLLYVSVARIVCKVLFQMEKNKGLSPKSFPS